MDIRTIGVLKIALNCCVRCTVVVSKLLFLFNFDMQEKWDIVLSYLYSKLPAMKEVIYLMKADLETDIQKILYLYSSFINVKPNKCLNLKSMKMEPIRI